MAETQTASSVVTRTDQYGFKTRSVRQPLKTTDMDPGEYAKDIGDIKRDQAQEIQDKVDRNLKVIDALQQLKTLSSAVGKQAQTLSNYLGVNKDVSNVWKSRTASVYNTLGQNAEHLVRVTPGQNSPMRSFSFEVTQVATEDSMQSTSSFVDKSANLGLVGSLKFSVGVQTYTVDVGGKSLSDIANAVNSISSETKVSMEILQTSSGGGYTWQLIHKDKTVPINLTGTDLAVLNGLFIPTNPLDATQPKITDIDTLRLKALYDGKPITRDGSNYVKDLVTDTVIEVYGVTAGAVDCQISQDTESVADAFAGFVKSYNDLRKFIRDQTAFESDKKTPKKDAYLHSVMVSKDEVFEVEKTLNKWVSGISGTAPRSMAAIGLPIGKSSSSVNSQGQMIVNSNLEGDIVPDVSVLEKLLYSDQLSQVLAVVGNQVTSTNSYFSVYSLPDFSKSSTLAGVPVTVNLWKEGGVIKASFSADTGNGVVTVNGDYSNGLIKGAKGSIFEGFSVGCVSSCVNSLVDNGPVVSTQITATTGILSDLQNAIDRYVAYQTGKLDLEVKRLEDGNTKNQEKIEKLKADAIKEEERILRDFERIREIEAAYQSFMEMFDSYMKLITSRN